MVEEIAAFMIFVDEEVGTDSKLHVVICENVRDSLLDRGTLPEISQYEGGSTPNYPDVGFVVVLVTCAEARQPFRVAVGIRDNEH